MGSSSTLVKEGKLIWLLFIHRHGDRAPLNMGPKDKYNDLKYWPEGFGNLDNAGRLRMYKLGEFLRLRYDGFLTDDFREIYSRSSDVDRCIESSHAVLAGLYPPSKRFLWDQQLPWIPAPVHSVPAPEDYLLNEAGRKYVLEVIEEMKKIQNSDRVKQLYAESVEERELLERELGYDFELSNYPFCKFKCSYSTLDIELRNGLEMPDWYTPELQVKLKKFAGISFALAGGGTERLKQLRVGHLLEDILMRMELASACKPTLEIKSDFQQPTNAPSKTNNRKVVHYSTHDSVMAALLESLNLNDDPLPPGFGATFFMELYVDTDESGAAVSEKYIKIFYMDDTDSMRPIKMNLPNCKLNEKGQLTVANFRDYVEHLLPKIQLEN